MNTTTNQPWDLGQAMAEFSTGIAKGVVDFFGLVMKPFENCGLGHESHSADNEQTDDDSVATNGRLVVRGGLSKDKNKNRRLTKETLGRLSFVGALASRGSTGSASSSSITLGFSNESSLSGSMSGEDAGSDDGVVSKGTGPRVTFDHGVDVRIQWHKHLARTHHKAKAGRDRAAMMVDGDDFWNLVETASASTARATIVQPPRRFSRAAVFALMEEDDGDKRGCQPIAYGRMKDIVSSARSGGSGGGEVDNDVEEEEEEQGLTHLFGSYDGSWASMKRIVFLPTLSSSRRVNRRLAKKLPDPSRLASRSPAQWMTPTELEDILSRTKGWKERSINGRRGGRKARRKTSYGFDGKLDSRTTPVRHEMCRVSVDNTVLKDELFGLAMQEHRAALLFKRAFLSWEGSSSSS